MKQFSEQLKAELEERRALGLKPVSLIQMKDTLKQLGYRLDRTMDCPHMARYMSGPSAGRAYPAISTRVREIDTGKTAEHFEARRDGNYEKLRDMRQSLFTVLRGAILEI